MDIDIENSISHELVRSPFIEIKLLTLIELLYEVNNISLCQTVGKCLHEVLNLHNDVQSQYNEQGLGYFLKHYKEKLTYIKLDCDLFHINEIFQLIVKSLEEQQSSNKDDLIFEASALTLNGDKISAQSFSAFTNLLVVHQYPVVELYFEYYPNEYLHFLSQILCYSKTLRVLDIKGSYLGYEGAVCLANCKILHLQKLGLSRCKLGLTGTDN